jgi:hypothetical protein
MALELQHSIALFRATTSLKQMLGRIVLNLNVVRIVLKKPTKLNVLRLLAYPIVKLGSSLRQLIVAVATKAREPMVQVLKRWG